MKPEILMRILAATAFDNCDDIWWRVDDEYAPITVFVNCNDLFWWATADCEPVNETNIDTFEQSYTDSEDCGGILFCCRMQKMRPQGAYYKYIDKSEWPLFDACGPEREVGFGNPLAPKEEA